MHTILHTKVMATKNIACQINLRKNQILKIHSGTAIIKDARADTAKAVPPSAVTIQCAVPTYSMQELIKMTTDFFVMPRALHIG